MKDISLFLTHGFMGVKSQMEFLANKFKEENFTVYNASMRGHDDCGELDRQADQRGFDEKIFMQTKWEDWFSSIETQFLEQAKKGKLILIGHSMGGVFVLKLAQKYPQHVHALVCLAAPIFINRCYPFEMKTGLVPFSYIAQYFVKKIRADTVHFRKKKKDTGNTQNHLYYYPPQFVSVYKNIAPVRKEMEKVTAPLLCIQAFDDKSIPDAASYEICRRTSSQYKVLKMYTIHDPQSGKHDIMCHKDTREQVYTDIYDFIKSLDKIPQIES